MFSVHTVTIATKQTACFNAIDALSKNTIHFEFTRARSFRLIWILCSYHFWSSCNQRVRRVYFFCTHRHLNVIAKHRRMRRKMRQKNRNKREQKKEETKSFAWTYVGIYDFQRTRADDNTRSTTTYSCSYSLIQSISVLRTFHRLRLKAPGK